jgi:pimeloyl-ACP methyl ester carboxylesterase
METATIDGQRFEYEVIGGGAPVVAMRNVAAPAGSWPTPGETEALVDAGLSLVSYRHLGTTDTIEGIAADVGGLLDHLALGPVALWGWSQGAMAAQELALARPDLVSAAVMMATRGRLSAYDRVRYAVEERLTGDAATLWAIVQNLSPGALCVDDVFERAWAGYSSATTAGDEQAARSARAGRAGAAYADRLDALRAVTVPCMVVAFADDVNIPPGLNREVADAIPGCAYVEIGGAGHSGGITHRREVRRHVLPFLVQAGQVSRPTP